MVKVVGKGLLTKENENKNNLSLLNFILRDKLICFKFKCTIVTTKKNIKISQGF